MPSRSPSPHPAPATALGPTLGPDAAAAALRQSPEHLGDFYRTIFPEVFRLSRGFLADRAAAEDVTQDVMLRLADSIQSWDPARPFAAWTRTATLNACRNHLRDAQRRSGHEEGAGEIRALRSVPAPSAAAEAQEAADLLSRALGRLPDREREVFVLIDLEGLASAEVAEACGITPSTVRASLAQARRRLRDALGPELRGAAPSPQPPSPASPGGIS